MTDGMCVRHCVDGCVVGAGWWLWVAVGCGKSGFQGFGLCHGVHLPLRHPKKVTVEWRNCVRLIGLRFTKLYGLMTDGLCVSPYVCYCFEGCVVRAGGGL